MGPSRVNFTADEHLSRGVGRLRRGQCCPLTEEASTQSSDCPLPRDRVVVSEKLAKQWSFFVKTLGLGLFSSSKSCFEHLHSRLLFGAVMLYAANPVIADKRF